ncbi:hypothetical protein AC1031_006543 [Aphanomyces cochlioides]|nr:hypothetical protein AC1031_006543 [Aphanomyces cochlioides]
MLLAYAAFACCAPNEPTSNRFPCQCVISLQRAMRFVAPLLLATSAVVAFQQLGQESPVIMVHDQVPSAIHDLLNLQQDTSPSRQLAAASGGRRQPFGQAVAARMGRSSRKRASVLKRSKSTSRASRWRLGKGNSMPRMRRSKSMGRL